MENLHPQEIDLGLSRVRQVAESLPIESCVTVTVAGTNGKGSCVETLKRLLLAQSKSVGTYTSPHLLRYNERITINGREATDEELCQVFAVVDEARGDISLTYFEFSTLAALLLFSNHNVQYRLLEVGLGGRLDAVNIIDPDIAIITSIAIDHERWLGSTRESIGYEKAGILRAKVPVVIADESPPDSVLSAVENLSAVPFFLQNDFGCRRQEIFWTHADEIKTLAFKKVGLPLPSVCAAVQAMSILGLDVELNALEDVKLKGRYEQMEVSGVQLILDVAHNPASTIYLAKQLSTRVGKVNALIAMMNDKQITNCLKPMVGLVDKWYITTVATERAASLVDLKKNLLQLHVDSDAIVINDKVSEIFDSALSDIQSSEKDNRLVIFGSFYLLGEVYKEIQSRYQ